jgi:hypothetical protein
MIFRKKIDDEAESAWTQDLLNRIEEDGFRVDRVGVHRDCDRRRPTGSSSPTPDFASVTPPNGSGTGPSPTARIAGRLLTGWRGARSRSS